ncbi:MAG: hypothetical protein AAB731_04595, partial [Patescibacteria group bacterium]
NKIYFKTNSASGRIKRVFLFKKGVFKFARMTEFLEIFYFFPWPNIAHFDKVETHHYASL